MPVMQRRAQDTRTGLLRAARDIFTEVGFAQANVADVVARASSSVGSMYHHFGGKADLYIALYEEHEARQQARAEAAVRQARASGDRDPVRLFAAGARAYLLGAWLERDLARMFLSGDNPPGFDLTVRSGFLMWLRRSDGILQDPDGAEPAATRALDPSPAARAQALVLTTAIGAGARAVTNEADEFHAMALADEVIAVIKRLART
jgi:AcrR family transcriptional regulator